MEEKDFQTVVIELIKNVQSDVRSVKEDVRSLKEDMREDRKKLDEIYLSRDKVKITFGWQWGFASLLIAVVASGITQVVG